jgi:hypothetical protein
MAIYSDHTPENFPDAAEKRGRLGYKRADSGGLPLQGGKRTGKSHASTGWRMERNENKKIIDFFPLFFYSKFMIKRKLSSISKADSLEKMGEFWNARDFTDYDAPDAPDVKFHVSCTVPIEEGLLSLVETQAKLRGVKVETLANLWLQQKLAEQVHIVIKKKK